MPTYKKQKKARKKKNNPEAAAMEMDLFDRFRSEIIPELQEDILNGMSADDIYKKYARFAAARAVTVALTDADGARGLAASKEIQDRASGKSVERRKITHEMESLTDEQLDALLLSRMEEIEDEEEESL